MWLTRTCCRSSGIAQIPDVLARWQTISSADSPEFERARTSQSFVVPKDEIAAPGYDQFDRGSATEALSTFTAGTTFTASQLDFVNLLVGQLTRQGVIGPELLFESPFTAVSSTGPVTLFGDAKVTELLTTLSRIRGTAEAG